MSNKAWAKNQSNDTTRKNLPNHWREVDAPLQCFGMEIDSLKGDGETWFSMTCGREGSGMVPEMWDKPLCESVWPYLDPWDSVRLRTAFHALECSEDVWGAWRALLLPFLKKESMVVSELVELGPWIPAETVKACALIGLHMMAEENTLRLDGDSSPEPGDRLQV